MAHGLSCSAACEIFQDQGSNPCPPALAGGFLTTVLPGKSPEFPFLTNKSGIIQFGNIRFYVLCCRPLSILKNDKT